MGAPPSPRGSAGTSAATRTAPVRYALMVVALVIVLGAAVGLATLSGPLVLPVLGWLILLGGGAFAVLVYRKIGRGFSRLQAAGRRHNRQLNELRAALQRLRTEVDRLGTQVEQLEAAAEQREAAAERREAAAERHRAATIPQLARIEDELAPLTASALAAITAPEPAPVAPDPAPADSGLRSLLSLHQVLSRGSVLPLLSDRTTPTDLLTELVRILITRRPALVVECGSGVSTLWLAATARTHDLGTRIVSLEHDAARAERTRDQLRSAQVEGVVDLRVAVPAAVTTDGLEAVWYPPSVTDDLQDIGLLLVGRPGEAQPPIDRYAAVPRLRDRLAAGATVVLDGSDESDDVEGLEIVDIWQAYLPDFRSRRAAAVVEFERP